MAKDLQRFISALTGRRDRRRRERKSDRYTGDMNPPNFTIKIMGKSLKLGGGFKYLLFLPRFCGEMIQFDEHIFQMGGSTTNSYMMIELIGRKG